MYAIRSYYAWNCTNLPPNYFQNKYKITALNLRKMCKDSSARTSNCTPLSTVIGMPGGRPSWLTERVACTCEIFTAVSVAASTSEKNLNNCPQKAKLLYPKGRMTSFSFCERGSRLPGLGKSTNAIRIKLIRLHPVV